MAAKQTSFRVLMFPWLAHGHVCPFLELAKKLSKRNFHVYFCSTPIILDSIRKDLNEKDSSDDLPIEFVELHLPSLPELPPHYHTTKNIPLHLLPTLRKAIQMSSSSFSDITTNLKPDLLIYDVWQPWSAKIASSQCIPSVHFSIVSSTSCSFYHHIYTHASNFDAFPSPTMRLREYEIRALKAEQASVKLVKDKGEGFSFGVFQLSSEIVLVKGCKSIEGKFIDHLSTLCGKKIVPTGPLIKIPSNLEETANSEFMNWLSKKSPCSTLYISFGSQNYFSKMQITEIAKGLEMSSDVNFIWVARSPPGSDIAIDEALPEGFLERVKDRGLVVQEWAPQAAILAHQSVGGFMSHCGWSSVVESTYFGVPLVGVPLTFDQPLNARLVVEIGVGVEVVRDENGQLDGEGVAKAIKDVFVGESGEGYRKKAKELSEKMKMEEEETIHEVIEELSRICLKK